MAEGDRRRRRNNIWKKGRGRIGKEVWKIKGDESDENIKGGGQGEEERRR